MFGALDFTLRLPTSGALRAGTARGPTGKDGRGGERLARLSSVALLRRVDEDAHPTGLSRGAIFAAGMGRANMRCKFRKIG